MQLEKSNSFYIIFYNIQPKKLKKYFIIFQNFYIVENKP